MKSDTIFKTIRQTAALGIFGETALRRLYKEGKLPGVLVGTRYYVNTKLLREQLQIPETQKGE